jgi:hypothetical protein
VVVAPNPVVINVIVDGPTGPLTSFLTVTGTVRRGDGSERPVTWLPGGNGRFTTPYSEYPTEGVYTFQLKLEHRDEPGVPAFTREVETTVLVRFPPLSTLGISPIFTDLTGQRWLSPSSRLQFATAGTRFPITVEYQVDGGAFQTFSTPFTIPTPGRHTVNFRSVDAEGIAESMRTETVLVDAAAPTTNLVLVEGPWVTASSAADWATGTTISLDAASRPGDLLLGRGENIAWTTVTHMDVLPSAEGWRYEGSSAEAQIASVAGGILRLQVPAGQLATYVREVTLRPETGWTVEARLRLPSGQSGTALVL